MSEQAFASPLPHPFFPEHIDPPLSTKRQKVYCLTISSRPFNISQTTFFLLQQLKGIQKRVPRLIRSAHSISRFSDRYELRGPRFIRFTTKGKNPFGKSNNFWSHYFVSGLPHETSHCFLYSLDDENAFYDKNDPREYFEQCFEKERKIGEGSFGEVGFLQ